MKIPYSLSVVSYQCLIDFKCDVTQPTSPDETASGYLPDMISDRSSSLPSNADILS